MKRREIILLIAVIAIIGSWGWMVMTDEEQPAGAAAESAAGVDLDATRAKFKENLRTIRQGKKIDDAYAQLSVGLEDNRDPRSDAGMAATGQLYEVLTKKLGVSTPNVSNAKEVEIKGVEDYHFINITFKVNGAEAEMKRLLYDVERLGFLIQSFRINQLNRGQAEYLDLEVVVSKLVKGKLRKPGSRR